MSWNYAQRTVGGIAVTYVIARHRKQLAGISEFVREFESVGESGNSRHWRRDDEAGGRRVVFSQRHPAARVPHEISIWVFGRKLAEDLGVALAFVRRFGCTRATDGDPAALLELCERTGLLAKEFTTLPPWLRQAS